MAGSFLSPERAIVLDSSPSPHPQQRHAELRYQTPSMSSLAGLFLDRFTCQFGPFSARLPRAISFHMDGRAFALPTHSQLAEPNLRAAATVISERVGVMEFAVSGYRHMHGTLAHNQSFI
ncbi:hypothetical protein DPEC_G00358690 [Dallia pectoralis]|uniref:Uncharacterized protein n=1 Tax=Dallia pectoralis TaxID=75939 RepID=A0ACC2F0B0_DALPE|nr:hypothetical protein DPEC_G00358690 [Dallia pectoralis]